LGQLFKQHTLGFVVVGDYLEAKKIREQKYNKNYFLPHKDNLAEVDDLIIILCI
jgi:hypothetical protein